MLTRQLALCLRHHSFGLREGFCLFCTYAELTLTGFCTPPQGQLTRSNFLKQNAINCFNNCLSSTVKQAGAHAFFFVWCGNQTAVGCGHEHQNQSKSKNYQSAPLECRLTTSYSQKECGLTRALRAAYAELTPMSGVKIVNLYLTAGSSQICKVSVKN